MVAVGTINAGTFYLALAVIIFCIWVSGTCIAGVDLARGALAGWLEGWQLGRRWWHAGESGCAVADVCLRGLGRVPGSEPAWVCVVVPGRSVLLR